MTLKSCTSLFIHKPGSIPIPCTNLAHGHGTCLVFPSNLVRDAAKNTELHKKARSKSFALIKTLSYPPPWFQFQNTQSSRNDHSLLLVIRWWNTVEHLEPLQRLSSPLRLVRKHAPNCSPENPTRGSQVEGTATRVNVAALVEKLMVLD